MEFDTKEEDKGKLFVRRVQQVLKSHDGITMSELLDKVDEMKDLMITLAKMLKHTTHKMKRLEVEKENLAAENATLLQLLNEMENNLSSSEINVKRFVNKCQQYEELKSQFEKLKTELSDIQKHLKIHGTQNEIGDVRPVLETLKKKTRKTQTNFPNNFGKNTLVKFENGVPIFDENSSK